MGVVAALSERAGLWVLLGVLFVLVNAPFWWAKRRTRERRIETLTKDVRELKHRLEEERIPTEQREQQEELKQQLQWKYASAEERERQRKLDQQVELDRLATEKLEWEERERLRVERDERRLALLRRQQDKGGIRSADSPE